ncbi:MAG: hypothetical protein AAF436_17455 [Myxococcota bacterium]
MIEPRERLLRLLQNPRVAALLQDARVQRAMFGALRTRGRIEERLERALERMAKRLNLATAREVRELKRTIRRLERELERDEPNSETP